MVDDELLGGLTVQRGALLFFCLLECFHFLLMALEFVHFGLFLSCPFFNFFLKFNWIERQVVFGEVAGCV